MANLVFQFESPKPVAKLVGIMSAAKASASSEVCLNLKVSSAPGAGGAPPFAGLAAAEAAAAAGIGFFGAGADAADGPPSPPAAAGVFLA